jgi:D-xylose transport system substrate-binding protein
MKRDFQLVKKICLVILTIVFVVQSYILMSRLFGSDKNEPVEPMVTEASESTFKVGISLGTLKEERWIKDRDILMSRIKDLGGEAIVMNANNDDEDQLKQVKYLVSEGIDVLIIVPNDLKKASQAVAYAKSKGVKVISYDRLVLDADIDYYISFDNEKVGEEMGRYIKSKLSRGNVLIINGAKSDHNTQNIKTGYNKTLKSDGINMMGEYWAENWLTEYAYETTEKSLIQGKQFEAILAGNDALAGAAIRALSEYKLAGKIIVVGQDADLSACQRIVEGTQSMTVYKPIHQLAEVTAKVAYNLAMNLSIQTENQLRNGRYAVPYIYISPIVVDAKNMDETIIKDGFHLKDEVYTLKKSN